MDACAGGAGPGVPQGWCKQQQSPQQPGQLQHTASPYGMEYQSLHASVQHPRIYTDVAYS